MVHFSRKWFAVPFILATLFAAGCCDHTYDYSDYEDHDSSRGSVLYDSSGVLAALSGKFSLEAPLIPKSLTITALTANLEEVDVIEATIGVNDSLGYTFTSDSSDYPTTFAKLTFTCTRGDSPDAKELSFEEYVDFGRYPAPAVNLFGALESNRVRYLVQEDGFYLGNAKKKASREIFRMFGMEWQEGVDFESDSIKFEALRLMPYLLAGSDNSDSAFVATFKKMSQAIGNGDSENATFRSDIFDTLKIADGLVARTDKRNLDFAKTDTTSLLFYSALWEQAYGLSECDSIGKTAEVSNKKSTFSQNLFVCEMRKDSVFFWKPLDSLDLKYIPCYHGVTDNIQHNDTVYACSDAAMSWVVASPKAAIEYLFGPCDYGNKGKYRAYHDHVFICEGYGFSIRWTDTISGFDREKAEFEAYFYNKYGDCTVNRENEKAAFNEEYFRCHNGKWESITPLGYVTDDSCSAGDTIMLPPSSYYRCDKNNNWNPISYFDYYNIVCSEENQYEVLHDGIAYHWCVFRDGWRWRWERIPADKQIPPVLNHDTRKDGHVVKYDATYYIFKNGEWEVLPNESAIPPVIHEDGCGETNDSTYVVYDGEYYLCRDSRWLYVSKENVIAPVLAGDSCSTDNKAEVRKYGDEYFVCVAGYNPYGQHISSHWSTATKDQIAIYDRNRNRGDYCAAGQAGTTLEWDKKAGGLFGCVKSVDGETYQWARIKISDMDSLEQKNFANGTFEKEGVYQCDVSGSHYVFDRFFWNDKQWKDYVRLRLEKATIGDVEYDARMINGKMYVRAPYGNKSVYLSDFETRSESFDGFYQRWSRWAGVNGSIKFVYHGENTFTTWDEAEAFCPAGFHIPDTTEWKKSGVNEWKRTIDSDEMNRISNVIQGMDELDSDGSFKRNLILLWSSTSKDDSTQYCFTYEISSMILHTNIKAVIECPKDLMPMGQAMCVRD